jgi:hypothetical protein
MEWPQLNGLFKSHTGDQNETNHFDELLRTLTSCFGEDRRSTKQPKKVDVDLSRPPTRPPPPPPTHQVQRRSQNNIL